MGPPRPFLVRYFEVFPNSLFRKKVQPPWAFVPATLAGSGFRVIHQMKSNLLPIKSQQMQLLDCSTIMKLHAHARFERRSVQLRDMRESKSGSQVAVVWVAWFSSRCRIQPLRVGRERQDRATDSTPRKPASHEGALFRSRGTGRDAALASDGGRAGEESSNSPADELKGKVLNC